MENYDLKLGHVTSPLFSPVQLSILMPAKIIISRASVSLLPFIKSPDTHH